MTYQVLGDFVLVTRDEVEEKVGMIFVPPASKDSVRKGTVVAVGEGKYSDQTGQKIPIPAEIKPGVRVLFRKNVGDEIKVDGVNYILIPAGTIQLVFKE